jgi:hypothetical protein
MSATRWQITLVPQQLPQRIEIVFAGKYAASARARELTFPIPALISPVRIGLSQNMFVQKTLWTVSGPSVAGRGAPLKHEMVAAVDQELARLESIAATARLDVDLLAAQPHDELARWYREWARRLVLARDAVRRAAAAAAATSSVDDQVSAARTIVAEHEVVAHRLGLDKIWTQAASQPVVAVEAAELWPPADDGELPPTRAATTGAISSVSVAYAERQDTDFPWRALAAMVLATGAAGMVISLSRPTTGEFLRRWPHVIGVLVGIFWWLWLWPSIFGWVIIVVSLLTSFRTGWRPRRSRSFSTVVAADSPALHS